METNAWELLSCAPDPYFHLPSYIKCPTIILKHVKSKPTASQPPSSSTTHSKPLLYPLNTQPNSWCPPFTQPGTYSQLLLSPKADGFHYRSVPKTWSFCIFTTTALISVPITSLALSASISPPPSNPQHGHQLSRLIFFKLPSTR